jgi:hypothetical protein
MSGFTWAAFICYLLVALGGVLIGFRCLTRSNFTPYHQGVLGQNWDQVDGKLQTLLIALYRTVGGGGLGANIGVMTMLFIPFRAGEMWAHYAIPAILLITGLSSLYGALTVRTRTRASSPIPLLSSGVVLTVVGFILSFF